MSSASKPERFYYNSSLQGDEYAAIRFDNNNDKIYPLKYYRDELKTPGLAELSISASARHPPQTHPPLVGQA
ncbi:MAG: hypothetical protein HC887_08250 [Desulfobacteraceae bacterium]|nr:hypothetical protein [Desulfobacteraceae bacterium]